MPINPYETSGTFYDGMELPQPGEDQLASRSSRLVAAIVDGLVEIAIMAPLIFYSGYFDLDAPEFGLVEGLMMTFAGMLSFLLLNGYLLAVRGQTIGKLFMRIQIVDINDGRLLPFSKVYVYRYLWVLPLQILTSVIPGDNDDNLVNLITLVDVLFIFGSQRRCLHDYIAESKVVMYQPDRHHVSASDSRARVSQL